HFAGRPKRPFGIGVLPAWVGITAQAPHRRVHRNVSVSPVNGVPLPSKREPDKRSRFLVQRGHQLCHSSEVRVTVRLGDQGSELDGLTPLFRRVGQDP
ncbi:MAG: hypothetical protein M3332_14275, partial [Actinomycetota bacterium]|nr:hypothetical protein [Actinomycetota bacterium]